jgi:enhancing lycopene biosynthesis protein 2
MQSLGQKPSLKKIDEVEVDQHLKIVSAPCYMMKASISEIRNNVQQAITALVALI